MQEKVFGYMAPLSMDQYKDFYNATGMEHHLLLNLVRRLGVFVLGLCCVKPTCWQLVLPMIGAGVCHHLDGRSRLHSHVGQWDASDSVVFSGIDIDGRREMITTMFQRADHSIKRYIDFCKGLPGFDELVMEDQIALIKGV